MSDVNVWGDPAGGSTPGATPLAQNQQSAQNMGDQQTTGTGNAWDDTIAPALAGAASGTLFGIPEAIAKQVNPTGTENYIKQHQGAYNAGNLAGSVAGSFIPVAGLAGKALQGAGAAAKLANMEKLGAALGTAGTVAKAGQEAKAGTGLAGLIAPSGDIARGITNNMIGQGIRSAAEGDQNAVVNIAGAGLWGAAGGVGGKLLGGLGKGLGELEKKTAGSTIATQGGTGRMILQDLNRYSGPGSAASKVGDKMDDAIFQHADMIADNGLVNPFGRDQKIAKIYQETKEGFDQLDTLYQQHRSTIDNLIEKDAKDIIGDNVAKFKDMLNPGTSAHIGEEVLNDNLSATYNQFINQPTMLAKKQFLGDILKNYASLKSTNPAAAAEYWTAVGLTKALNNHIDNLAEAAKLPQLSQLNKKWGTLQLLAKMNLKEEAAGTAAQGVGSQTAAKFGLADMVAGTGNPVRAMGAAFMSPFAEGLAKGVQYGTNALGAKAYQGLRALNRSDTGQKVIKNLEGLGQLGPGAARLGEGINAQNAYIADQNKDMEALTPSGIGGMADDVAQVAHESDISDNRANEFMQHVENGIKQQWMLRTYGVFGPADESNPYYAAFAKGAYSGLNDGQGGIDKVKAGNVIFMSDADKKTYNDALETYRPMAENLKAALGSQVSTGLGPVSEGINQATGFFNHGSQGVQARNALIGAFTDAAKSSGIDANVAKNEITAILNSNLSIGQKHDRIMEAWSQFNPNAVNVLGRGGLR